MQATKRGLRETLDGSEAAFRTSLPFSPALRSGDQPLQREVLLASLRYWQSKVTKQYGLGYNDPRAWETTYRFLRASGLLAKELDVHQAYINELIRVP